jgi:hypothetical protein
MNTKVDQSIISIDRRFFLDRNSASGRAFVGSGLWLRAGFVGAGAFAIGLIALFTGEASALTALTCLVAGGAFAAFAWRRCWAALNHVETSLPAAPAPIEPAPSPASLYGKALESAFLR